MTYGFILLDKPENITSFGAVAAIRKIFNIKKVGHAGTLDPLASGVLPIAIGEGTKFLEYISAKDKEYEFSVKFGIETDSLDKEGNIVNATEYIPQESEIIEILKKFHGKILQTPPKFSAIKIQGKRAYSLARKNIEFEIEPREVEIFNLELINYDFCNAIGVFRTHASKGTYIRSLARDIAYEAGSLGYVEQLRRTKFAKIDVNRTIKLEKLEEMRYNGQASEAIVSIQEVLDDIPAIDIDDESLRKLSCGQSIICNIRCDSLGPLLIRFDGKIRGIANYDGNVLKPIKNLNL